MFTFGLCSTRHTGISSVEGYHAGQGDNYLAGGCEDDIDKPFLEVHKKQ